MEQEFNPHDLFENFYQPPEDSITAVQHFENWLNQQQHMPPPGKRQPPT